MYHAYLILEEWLPRDAPLHYLENYGKRWRIGIYSDATLSCENIPSAYSQVVLIEKRADNYDNAKKLLLEEIHKKAENDPIYALYETTFSKETTFSLEKVDQKEGL